jgi:hypothetical protein
MKKFFIALMLVLSAAFVSAQNGSITGRIVDSSYKKPFALATVTVFRAVDTSVLTYRLTSESGEFRVPNLPLNTPLRFIVSFSGHTNHRQEFMLTISQSQLKFDSIMLKPVSGELEEVLVIAERPPVMIRKDTIEFNANSFKTLPNALVEDLLKKLPGVQLDGEGNITVNGKTVNRILVDGKAFFGDDPKMATRNLPANIIDKVQVVDDKDQQLITGTLDPNQIGKVINLTFKKGIKKGWFGKIYGGGGTEDLYEAGAIANIFRDTLQLSLLGYANNINKSAFTLSDAQQIGGFNQNRNTGVNSSMGMGVSGLGSSLSLNGISFGGLTGGGIATSRGAGFNLNHTPNPKKSFFVQYFYGNSVIDRRSTTDISQFFSDTTVTNLTRQDGNVINNSHNAGIGLRIKPDSVTTLIMSANYVLSLGDEDKLSMVRAANNKIGDLSRSNNFQNNESTSHSYRHNINFVKLSRRKKGRRISINQTLDVNNRHADYLTEGDITLLYPDTITRNLNQLRQDKLPRTDIRTYANYSEPISERFSFRLISQTEYGRNKNEVNTFGQSMSKQYDSLYAQLSSGLKRQTGRFINSFSLEYRYKNLTIAPTLRSSWQGAEVESPLLVKPFKQSIHNVLPALNVVYKQISFTYDQGVILPGIQHLIAVTNNSDPYFVTKTNPNLVASVRNSFIGNYFYNDIKRSLNFYVSTQLWFTKNDIVNQITVDGTGVQTTTPVNTNGSRNLWLNYNISKQFKRNQRFTVAVGVGGSKSFTRTRLLFNSIRSWQNTFGVFNWGNINLNWRDKVEWNNTVSTSFNFTRYPGKELENLNLSGYDVATELIVRYPKHVIWESRVGWTRYASVTPGFPRQVVRWTAGVNFTMLKDERGVLNFRVYDILNQNNSVLTSVNRNMISITSTNVLPRYFMASFTYNIRTMGASKRKVGGWLNL